MAQAAKSLSKQRLVEALTMVVKRETEKKKTDDIATRAAQQAREKKASSSSRAYSSRVVKAGWEKLRSVELRWHGVR